MPTDYLKIAGIAIAVVGWVIAGIVGALYTHELKATAACQVEASRFKGEVSRLGQEAADKAAKQLVKDETLRKEINDEWNTKSKEIEQAAVNRFVARYGNRACSVPNVPANGSGSRVEAVAEGSKVDGDGKRESISVERTTGEGEAELGCPASFIKACASDAEYRQMTVLWLKRSGIEVE